VRTQRLTDDMAHAKQYLVVRMRITQRKIFKRLCGAKTIYLLPGGILPMPHQTMPPQREKVIMLRNIPPSNH
jgi:hypothetical protein